jgi:SAM-dependent methyltransferase
MFAPGTELLDDPAADPAAVRRSLGNIARANRLFGGTSALIWAFEHAVSDVERRHLDVLDLGTGAGDLPAALRAWGRRRGRTIRTFGLERLRPAATMARGEELPVALACVSALPFRTGSVDVVTISQVLHHFDRAKAVQIIAEARRVARHAVVVADLLRSRTAALLFGVGATLLGFDAHTRSDGITSVGRGYRPEELHELLCEGGRPAAVTVRPGWRVVGWGAGG